MKFWDYFRSVVIAVAVVIFIYHVFEIYLIESILTVILGSVCVLHIIDMYHDFIKTRTKKNE